jgi:hypothetical protein
MWVVPVAGMAGNPIRRRDDVDAAFEQSAEKIDVRPNTEVRHAVGLGGDDVFDTVRCLDANGVDTDNLARIAANLVLAVAVQPNELEVRMLDRLVHHLAAHVTSGELKYFQGRRSHFTFSGDSNGSKYRRRKVQ